MLEEPALVTLKDVESEEGHWARTAFSSALTSPSSVKFYTPSLLSTTLNGRYGGVPHVLQVGTQIDIMLDESVYL